MGSNRFSLHSGDKKNNTNEYELCNVSLQNPSVKEFVSEGEEAIPQISGPSEQAESSRRPRPQQGPKSGTDNTSIKAKFLSLVPSDGISLYSRSRSVSPVRSAFLSAAPGHEIIAGDSHSIEVDPSSAANLESSDRLKNIEMDPDSLNALRDGLNEALGLDGHGTWLQSNAKEVLVEEDGFNDDSQHDNYNDPSFSSESTSIHTLASIYRQSQIDDVEERRTKLHKIDTMYGSASGQIVSAFKHFSNRLAHGSNYDKSNNNNYEPLSLSHTASLHPSLAASSIDYENYDDLAVGSSAAIDRSDSVFESASRKTSRVEDDFSDRYSLTDNNLGPMFSQHSYAPSYDDNDTTPLRGRNANSQLSLPPLYGNSLKLFGPKNKFRLFLFKLLQQVWVEPFLFLLIMFHVVLLSFRLSRNPFPSKGDGIWEEVQFLSWGESWTDYGLLSIFIIYTLEMVAKMVVYGIWDDSQTPMISSENIGWKKFLPTTFVNIPKPDSTYTRGISQRKMSAPILLTSFTMLLSKKQKYKNAPQVFRAYLRGSWHRVDFISVISFWVSFIVFDIENEHKIFIVRMLSSLKILKLLNLTFGTASVLRSVKKAIPLLANVAVFIGFFWLLFAIIGTQSFKSSLRRTCVWVDPEGIEANYTTQQFCGSYLDPQTWTKRPYVFMDGMPSSVAKGFTCPAQSLCVSNENPYGGTVSFDNIFYSLEMVFVVMSTNTYTDIMYDTMNTDYVVSSLFFIIGVVVLSFWLINLLIAVIASSFRLVRDERVREKQEKSYMKQRNTLLSKNTLDSVPHLQYLLKSKIGIWYYRTRIIWPILIMVDLVIQSIYGSTPTASTMQVNYHWQIWMNVIFTIEIIIRFIAYLPFWRVFFASKRNLVDLFLVIINFIILLPFVHDHSELYSWLTAFQIMRFYRNAVSFPFARDLWRKVLGNYRTIFNLAVFLFLLTFLCSILASQLFSGVVPLYSEGDVNIYSFFDLADSFVSMYIILSTENWTEITYPAIQSAPNVFVGACFGAFFIIWFIVSSFIVLSMFIAVIAENLDISTELKRSEQLKAFVKEYASASSARETFTNSFASVKNYIFKQIGKEEKQRKDGLNSGEAVFDLLLQKRVVEEFLDKSDPTHIEIESTKEAQQIKSTFVKKIVQTFKRGRFDNPFDDKYALHEKIRRDMLNIEDSNGIRPTDFAQEFIKMRADLEERQIKFLKEHPKYDYSLNIFGPDNKLRQICQRIVEPSYGRRNSGIVPSRSVWYSFWLFMFLCSNALVIATCINTPLYLKQISENLSHKWSWTVYADLVFVIIFTTEASIKIIADGLITPPNAYWRSTWNKIDLLVLNMLWITFLNEAFSTGYISRYIRAIEALRALRLMTVSAQAQATFHDVIISGIGKIFSATVISLLLLFPFSVWGLNLYSGKLSFCTDSNIGSFSDCVDEYLAEPFNWEIYAPRAITKTYYDYDTFWHSFLITFEVISLEGWVDVLGSVIAITGSDSNPIPLASRYNGIFPIFYNIIAITFILTLFVAVIIKNYAQIRGTAFLTDEQLSWYEVQKMLETVKPSIRYPKAKVGSLRELFQRQIEERKSWMKYIDSTILLVIVLIVLIQYYPSPKALTTVQNVLLLVFILFYLVLYIFKIYAMGFKKFLNKKWMIYGVIISLAALASTIADLKLYQSEIYTNFQKVAIIGMLLLCIPKSRRLDKLFKTASASFRVIGDLMFTWFILFLVYAIAFNQVFGLTRIGPNGDQNLNFRTVPKALILLFRMSCGEGWNQILNDYLVSPPYCVSGSEFEETDCGSHPFAYFLFISWNILSMYIFVNMFVSLIYENFRYVFHHGGVRISRRDIKLFKKAWLEFDPQGTGYIDPSNLHKLLHRCEGYFSMSIYYGNYTVSNLLKKAMIDRKDSYDVDYVALNSVMRNYPGDVFKKRRQLYELFCEQALEEAHPSKGISFSALLHQFPLYKDIDYSKYLK